MTIEALKELCAGCKVAEHCWWPASTGHNETKGCPCFKCPIKPICQEVCERSVTPQIESGTVELWMESTRYALAAKSLCICQWPRRRFRELKKKQYVLGSLSNQINARAPGVWLRLYAIILANKLHKQYDNLLEQQYSVPVISDIVSRSLRAKLWGCGHFIPVSSIFFCNEVCA